MGLETKIIERVKKDVLEKHSENIFPWFEYGTLWVNKIDNEVSETIKKSIENFYIFENCIAPNNIKVVKTLLKPTEREPWNEYAFDF